MHRDATIGGRGRVRHLVAVVAAATVIAMGCQAPPPAPGGPMSTTTTTTTPPGAVQRIDLEVLVVSADDIGTAAISGLLTRGGVPWTEVDLTDPGRARIDEGFLADTVGGVRRSRFQGIVLPDARPSGLSPAEMTAIDAVQDEFGIRRIAAFTFPGAAVGLSAPLYAGPVDGLTGRLTPSALAGSWGYLRGEVAFDDIDPAVPESYGFLSTPIPDDPGSGSSFESVLEMPVPGGGTGVVAGVHRIDRREQLVLTASMNVFQRQLLVLGDGVVDWLTRGVHLGANQNHFTVHADDVFVPNARWSIPGNCTPGSDCPPGVSTPTIRMQESDVVELAAWQQRNDYLIDLAHNGEGHEEIVRPPGGWPGAPDPMGSRLITQSSSFRWINHTWSHEYLGCMQDRSTVPWTCVADGAGVQWASGDLISQQVGDNLAWSASRGIATDPRVLVTGEHSGLRRPPQEPSDNPFLAPRLEQLGVEVVASDASYEPRQRLLGNGSIRTLPRYPFNLFYNVATRAELVDEYNWIYNSAADGGSGLCTIDPRSACIAPLDLNTGFDGYIRPLEARLASLRILNGLPQPHYAHQSDLTEDRLLLDVVGDILAWYRAAFTADTPLLNPTMWDAAQRLGRIQAWRDALAAPQHGVTAYLLGDELIVESDSARPVPVTVPLGSTTAGAPFGERYGVAAQAWAPVEAGAPLVVRVAAAR